MAKTVIDIPDDCRSCPCFVLASANIGPSERNFHLCRAFSRILAVGVNGIGKVNGVYRCAECKDAEEGKKIS